MVRSHRKYKASTLARQHDSFALSFALCPERGMTVLANLLWELVITRETRARSDDKPFYICLNPPKYDIELADKGIANCVGERERRGEGRLNVRARWTVHRLQIVAHVAVENLG